MTVGQVLRRDSMVVLLVINFIDSHNSMTLYGLTIVLKLDTQKHAVDGLIWLISK